MMQLGLRPRIIPVLLLHNGRLIKGRRFRRERYLGDPLNAVRIFNEKEADELVILDIAASTTGRPPDSSTISALASECFMPLCYGGGITRLSEIEAILRSGIEKVCLGAAAIRDPGLVCAAVRHFGSQSIVICLDVRRSWWRGEHVAILRGSHPVPGRLEDHLRRLEDLGAGEIIVQSIDRDGTMAGYDIDLVRRAAASVRLPVVALGGAGTPEHLASALAAGASGAAAGSMFVFHGPLQAVLISYVDPSTVGALAQGHRP